MKTTIISNLFSTRRRLAELGIELSVLVDAIRAGCLARMACTELDPRMFPGSAMWAATVRQLRLGMIPRGWTYSESGNYSRTISGDGRLVIVVATGDEATGFPDQTPSTQSRKGPRTVEVVATNADQLDLPFAWPLDIPQNPESGEATTWLLLIHFSSSQVRAELARPVSFDETLRVSGWHERIILPTIEAEPDDLFEFGPDESPDIDIQVSKRV